MAAGMAGVPNTAGGAASGVADGSTVLSVADGGIPAAGTVNVNYTELHIPGGDVPVVGKAVPVTG